MAINDGGPAFPRRLNDNPEDDETRGMSLRDFFAAAALTGYLANPEFTPDGTNSFIDASARDAYAHADAMLKQREAGVTAAEVAAECVRRGVSDPFAGD